MYNERLLSCRGGYLIIIKITPYFKKSYLLTVLTLLLIINISHLGCSSVVDTTTTISSDVIIKNETTLALSVSNNGDENVNQLSVAPFFNEYFIINGTFFVENLKVNNSNLSNFNLSLKNDSNPGNYPIVFLISYIENSGVRHSYPANHLIEKNESYSSDIDSRVTNSEVIDDTLVNMEIKILNFDDIEHDVKLKLYLPNQVKSSFSQETIPIGQISDYTLGIGLEPQNAIIGREYIILLSIEYDYEGKHYTTFLKDSVSFQINDNSEENDFSLILILIVIYVIILIFYIYLKFGGK